MVKKDKLREIYEKDPDSGAYIIEVDLDQYTDVFNEWDPAPFKQRDLDPDLRLFLGGCSLEIPLKHPLLIRFYLPREKQAVEKENIIISGIRTYYSFNLFLISKKLRQMNRKGGMFVLISFAFLFLAVYLESLRVDSVIFKTLLQGLFIGGWVFLWEAISLFAFETRETKLKSRESKRIANAKIDFKYRK